jgi:LPS export ABC transporter protein LptC
MRFASTFAVLGLLAAGCAPHAPPSGSASPAPRPGSASATPTQVPIHVETRGGNGQYVTIVESMHGRKVYTIRALSGVAQRYGTEQGSGELEQPHVTFVDRSGTTTIADAPKARVFERDKTVVMSGGVHAHTSSGSVLTCDTLTYRGTTERFRGEGHVVLSAPNGLQLGGEHLDGDVKLQDVRVTGAGA